MLSFVSKHVLRFLVITLITLVIVVALLTGLLRLGLPYASSYKNEIQDWVSNYLRAPVELGSFDLGWHGFSPSLRLKEVTLHREGDQRVDIKLDEMLLDLNLYKSLFTGSLQINEVSLAGADLVLEYVGKQNFKISSYRLPASEKTGKTESSLDVVSWLMNADKVGLVDSRIRLVDNKRGIDYQINELNINAENTSDLHRLRLSMDLPDQLGASLQIEMDLNGSSDALDESNGRFYASVVDMNLESWMRIWPRRPLNVSGGGNVEFWGTWASNELLSIRGQLDGTEVQVAEASVPNDTTHNFPTVSTDLFWQRGANGWRTEIDKLDFQFDNTNNQIRKALIAVEKTDAGDHYSIAGEGQSLALAAIGGLLAELGQTQVPKAVVSYARQAHLKGELSNWKLDTSFHPVNPLELSVQGKLTNAETLAVGKIPGLKNLSGDILLDKSRGQFKMGSSDFVMDIPTVFSQPLALEKITGQILIDLNDAAKLVTTDDLSVRNQGLALVSGLSLGRDTDNDWHIDLQAAAQLDNIAEMPSYLPDRIMRQATSTWIENALVDGRASSASLLLFGKLKDFPYSKKPGLFRAEVVAENATLKFRPDWPAGTQVNGKAIFEGDGMRFSVDKGVLSGTDISRVDGKIANFREPLLTLSGATNGTLRSFVDFSNQGPLKKILSPAFQQVNATGNAVLNFDLEVPLRSKANRPSSEVFSVDGTVFLANNTLSFNRFDVELEEVSGAVSFSESGLTINNLGAQFLGSPIGIKAQSKKSSSGNSTELTAQGLLRTDEVLSHFNIPAHSFFTGPAQWDVALNIPLSSKTQEEAAITLTAKSNLIGTAISLPEPLRKDTATKNGVIVKASFDNPEFQNWQIDTDTARLHVRTKAEAGLQSLNVLFGQGQFKPQFSNGIFVNGVSPELAFDGWIEAINQIIADLPESDGPPAPLLPIYADVGAQQLVVGQSRMGVARVRANTDDGYINVVMNSSHLRGSIRIPRAHWDRKQAIKARIAYADSILLDALAESDGSEPGTPLDPTSLPRLEAHVSRFVFKSLTLNNLGLRAEPDAAGLKITALGFANENAQLVGEGTWHISDPQQLNSELPQTQQTRLSLNLQSNNIGQTLQQAGYGSVLAEGEGSASIDINWAGAAYQPDLQKLSGEAKLYAKDGRILKIDPGAARLVGLIALQELPRRLSLDFRDVVKDGLDYKRMSGDFTIGGGVALTNIFRVEGPIGVVEIQGKSDLLAQTFDQSIRVLPRVSAALPIIAVLSGGASAGIGALLVTPVLKAFGIDINRIGLTEYSLTGSWDKPQIDRISRAPATYNDTDNQ